MQYKSEHITQASGSVGGVTYSRAKGGTLYRRARAIPVNPQTTFQSQVRAALTSLVNAWIDTITAAQREAWATYGSNVLFNNALGDPTPISGQNCFIGANTPRLQSDDKLASTLARIDDAPTIFDRGDYTTPVVAASAAAGIPVAFTDTDAWVDEDDAAMLIYQGKPRNQSRIFFKGPYRLVGVIEGDGTTPPTTPATIATAAETATRGFPLIADQMIDFVSVVVRADGRWSSRRKQGQVIVS